MSFRDWARHNRFPLGGLALLVASVLGVFTYELGGAHRETMAQSGVLPRDRTYGEIRNAFFEQNGGIRRLAPNGLRMRTDSIKTEVSYGVDLTQSAPDSPARGTLYLYFGYSCWVERRFEFTLPAKRYEVAMDAFDGAADNYWGHSGYWLDGTGVAYERIRGPRITSNASNREHLLKLGNVVLEAIRPTLPPEILPPNERWSSWDNPATTAYVRREAKKAGCTLSQP